VIVDFGLGITDQRLDQLRSRQLDHAGGAERFLRRRTAESANAVEKIMAQFRICADAKLHDEAQPAVGIKNLELSTAPL